MKTIKKISILMAASAFLLFSCTETVTNTDQDDIDSEEVEVLQNVIADAISDQQEGFMASLYDLTAMVKDDRLVYGNNRDWRGNPNEYNYTYDPETGTHTVQYRRGFNRPNHSKLLQVILQYIYTDADGNFIARPAQDAGLIETIQFNGSRSGHTEGPRRSSEFERTAEWMLEDFNTDTMLLSGDQSHTGSMTVNLPRHGNTVYRSYDMQFNLVDITIEKTDPAESRLEYMITGLIEYDVVLIASNNNNTREREFSGVIELTGDGSALLRVLGINQVFRLDLASGEVDERT